MSYILDSMPKEVLCLRFPKKNIYILLFIHFHLSTYYYMWIDDRRALPLPQYLHAEQSVTKDCSYFRGLNNGSSI